MADDSRDDPHPNACTWRPTDPPQQPISCIAARIACGGEQTSLAALEMATEGCKRFLRVGHVAGSLPKLGAGDASPVASAHLGSDNEHGVQGRGRCYTLPNGVRPSLGVAAGLWGTCLHPLRVGGAHRQPPPDHGRSTVVQRRDQNHPQKRLEADYFLENQRRKLLRCLRGAPRRGHRRSRTAHSLRPIDEHAEDDEESAVGGPQLGHRCLGSGQRDLPLRRRVRGDTWES
mmetsp:Transcript_31644/g.67853  ORF Transcript_31644/g.67853 Transcript_31644/m.67853 type:complete len:231 (-) Transcript_31644:927-1619(-)